MTSEHTVDETYRVKHARKGEWEAKLLAIQGQGTSDIWYVMSDNPSAPIRASLCTLTKVEKGN